MARIRSLIQLQDALDVELGWRVKEIGVFSVGSKINGPDRKCFIRAGVALVYAHWEGFIKASSEKYLEFIYSRGHTYRELKSCFAIVGLKNRLNSLSLSKKYLENIESFNFIVANLDQIAHAQTSSAIKTESNLTSVVFENIANSIDINIDEYSTKFNLIDESLVNRRNKVAHGEYLDISGKEFGVLVEEITSLMRSYKTDLENAASLKSYKK